MNVQEKFIESLHPFRQFLKLHDASLEEAINKAHASNPWFIPEFSRTAVDAIANQYLDETKCKKWMETYLKSSSDPKDVGIIMAGNIPLVGFHDLLCVLASGHNAIIKMSEKDTILTRFIADAWIKIEPSLADRIRFTDKLQNFDAVIATGSNNSARYFKYYFRNHPHILRQNRNGVAVINGNETSADLRELAKDIFLYFGLGCRSVSKIYVPEGYDFSEWNKAIEEWSFLGDHNKYKNNLDYNFAIYIINRVPHINLGHLILKEDDAIASRIGCVHYSFYADPGELKRELERKREFIQCLVSKDPVPGWEHILPGKSQLPSLFHYADGIDTMAFLSSLNN